MPPLDELQSRFDPNKKRRGIGRVLGLALFVLGLATSGTVAFEVVPDRQLAAAGAADATAFTHMVNSAYASFCPFLNLCADTVAARHAETVTPPLPVAAHPATVPSTPRTPALAQSPLPAQPPLIQNITNPIRERVVEHVVTNNAHSDNWFAAQLATLENKLSTEIVATSRSIIVPTSGEHAPVSMATFALSQNIGSLANTAISNPTITGGSITGASISGTISNVIATALATIGDLTATTLVATNATFTNTTTTNATTTNLAITGTATIGSGTGVLRSNAGLVTAITNGTNGQVLKIVGGVPSWAVETGGGGGGSSVWATTTDNLAIYTADPTQTVLIGTTATSTNGNILEVKGNGLVRGNVTAQGIAIASSFTATSSANSSLPNVTSTNSTTTNATTTTFAATTASTTNLKTNTLSIASLSGFLKATAGTISSALLDLAANVTGILPVTNGGTGWAALAAGAIPYGNGSSALATTTAGTAGQVLALLNGVPTWTATSTLVTISGLLNLSSQVSGLLGVGNGGTGSTTLTGILKGNGTGQVASAVAGVDYEFPLTFNTPLSRTANAISISTAGDWTGTLSGFTSAQLIAAGFSTTSADAWKLTRNFHSTTSADYWLTQKTTDNLAQGAINKYYATSLFAADLAATTTTALAEGGNLYFTNNRVQTYLTALDKGFFFSTTSAANFLVLNTSSAFSTTSASNFLSLNQGVAFSTTSVNYWKSVIDLFSTTSASAFLAVNQGNAFSTSSASYFLSQNASAGFSTTSATYFAHASTTIPKAYSSNIFTNSNTFNGSLAIASLNGPLQANNGIVSATSSIGISYGGTGTSTVPSYGKLLVGNTLGGYDLLATSSLGISSAGSATWGLITGTLSNQTDLQNALNARFDYSAWYATTTNALAEGSNNLYFTNSRVQTYLNAVDRGFFFSTTSASNFLSLNTGAAFSTTSANYWKTVNDFFSTTSSAYFLSVNQGPAFSTSSASFFLSQNTGTGFSTTSAAYFAHASTTIPKTYTANAFTALQTFGNASTTNISAAYASSTQGFFGSLSLGSLSGILKATTGVIASALVNLATDITGILPVANGGTGWAAFASGAIPYGNGSSALATTTAGTAGQVLALLNGVPTWTATSTLVTISGLLNLSSQVSGLLGVGNGGTGSTTLTGILKGNGTGQVASAVAGVDYEFPLTFNTPLSRTANAISISTAGDWTGTLSGFTSAQLIAAGFSTTSADAWKLTRNFHSTTSADYWLTQKTTDNLAQGAINKYYATSLFAADLAATTTTALAEGGNLYFTNNRVQTYLTALDKGFFFSTTSAANFLVLNTSSAFSTTSASNFLSLNQGVAFSTTSVNYWKSVIDLFSTTSASAFLAVNQGNAFSTSSASYFLSQNASAGFSTTSATYFAHASTTIPKAYSSNIFTNSNTFNGSLAIASLNGPLQANNGIVSATSSIGISYGGTGTSTVPSYGKLLVGNTLGGYDLLATSSLGISSAGSATWGLITGTLSNQTDLQNALNARFDYSAWYATTTNALAEGSNNLYFTNSRVQTYLNAVDRGFFFSTTSASNFLSLNTGAAFSTTSANYWKTVNDFFSTTSSAYFLSVNQGPAFSTSSASFFLSQNTGTGFSTTSAAYFAHASTTIPKTYTANAFTALQTFGNASTTNISAAYASSTQGFFGSLSLGSLSGILKATTGVIASALVNLATDITGILPVTNGGTGWATFAAGAIPYGNGSSALATTTAGTAGQVLALLNGVPTWTSTSTLATIAGSLNLSSQVSGTLGVGNGGTGSTTLTGILKGNGTSQVSSAIAGTDYQAPISSSYPLLFSSNSLSLAFGTTTANSWSQLQIFPAGFLSPATTTIGNGTQAGGLTINGGATTTGNAYFAGNVGIGNKSPTATLHVGDGTGSGEFLKLQAASGAAQGAYVGLHNSSGNLLGLLGQYAVWQASGTSEDTVLAAQGSRNLIFGTNANERLRIDSSGNVGIGTTSPTTNLSVSGSNQAKISFEDRGGLTGTKGFALIYDGGNAVTNGGLVMQAFTDAGAFSANLHTFFRNGSINFGGLTAPGTAGQVVFTGGNVGIGTTTPTSILDISANEAAPSTSGAAANGALRIGQAVAGGSRIVDFGTASTGGWIQSRDRNTYAVNYNLSLNPNGGVVLIGTTTAYADGTIGTAPLQVNAVVGAHTGIAVVNPNGSTAAVSMIAFVNGNGAVGSISTNGSATAYNTSSDRRVKDNIATTTLGLDDLMKIGVRDFSFIKDSSHATTSGFIAQELRTIFPWAVSTNGDNGIVPLSASSSPWAVDYGRITPLIVKAIQDIASIGGAFKSNLVAFLTTWLADATNGIHQFFADIGNFTTVNTSNIVTDQLCIGSGPSATCINQSQLAALLSAAPAATLANPSPSSPPSSPSSGTNLQGSTTAPVIQVNGNNPATIIVGSTYADLGATIVSPAADTNLGMTVLVDSATSTDGIATISTTFPGTHTITYTVTNPAGLTGLATRTVIVSLPANDTSLPLGTSTSNATSSAAQ